MTKQLPLFDFVGQVYAEAGGPVTNEVLYKAVCDKAGIAPEDLDKKAPIGQAQAMHSPLKRQVRWFQQTLKTMGLIERVENGRGLWSITSAGKVELRKAEPTVAMLAYSTDLGIAIWGPNTHALRNFNEPIHLMLSSPPYPQSVPRAYGNCREEQYVDFICHALEPIVRNLVPGAAVLLNIGNEVFRPNMPARSTYRERMVIALEDRLGLFKVDELIWENPAKLPGPTAWACKNHFLLNPAYEPCYFFTNDPLKLIANTDRVLRPHTEQHKKLLAKGGEQRRTNSGDGSNDLRPGSFGRQTAGTIPRNVLHYGATCPSQRAYQAFCTKIGIPWNSAPMPLKLAKFLIEYLTEPGQLVVDIFGGSVTTGLAAEELGRTWLVCEQIWDYLRGSAGRFLQAKDYRMNPMFELAGAL